MAFQNDTNRGRVDKILEILDLIDKSAAANKVHETEVREMLESLFKRLVPEVKKVETVSVPPPKLGSHRYWNNVRELCEEADLEALAIGMTIFMDRVQERLK